MEKRAAQLPFFNIFHNFDIPSSRRHSGLCQDSCLGKLPAKAKKRHKKHYSKPIFAP